MNDNDESSKVFFEKMGKNLAKNSNDLEIIDLIFFPVLICKLILKGWNNYKEDKISKTRQND